MGGLSLPCLKDSCYLARLQQAQARWCPGERVPWRDGALARWCPGEMVPRREGAQARGCPGEMVPWRDGATRCVCCFLSFSSISVSLCGILSTMVTPHLMIRSQHFRYYTHHFFLPISPISSTYFCLKMPIPCIKFIPLPTAFPGLIT